MHISVPADNLVTLRRAGDFHRSSTCHAPVDNRKQTGAPVFRLVLMEGGQWMAMTAHGTVFGILSRTPAQVPRLEIVRFSSL